MFDRFKQSQAKKVGRKFLESEYSTVALQIVTEAERTLLESVQEQRRAIGLDDDLDQLPSKEDRAEQIRQMALAKIEDRLPEHIVEVYLGHRLEHVDEAAECADLDQDEWIEQKESWADDLREQGATGSDEQLAEQFVEVRFGVDLDEFYHLVVNWPEGREGQEIENIVASGLQTANQGINRTTEVLQEADVDVQED